MSSMILATDLEKDIYLYAQALDNGGGAEYWRVAGGGHVIERLSSDDARLSHIRTRLDALQESGRRWNVGGNRLSVRVNFRGECVWEVEPETLDAAGRVSPVLILFGAVGRGRRQLAVATQAIESHLNRRLAPVKMAEVERFLKILLRPAVLIYLHILIFSRRGLS